MDNLQSSQNTIKSILGFSLPTWINAAIGFMAVPLVTRLFAPETLGKFNLFCTYCTILSCVALAGLNQGYMRFYHEPPGKKTSKSLLQLCMALALAMTLIVAAVIILFRGRFSTAVAGEYSSITILCMVIYVAATVILNLISSAYRMRNALYSYGLLTVLMNLCAKLSYAGGALWDNEYNAMIVFFTVSYSLLAIVCGIRMRTTLREERICFRKDEVFPLLKYSLPLMPILFISQINTALPKLVIAEQLDYSQVGIYASAYSVVSIISIVQSGINVFWAPFVFSNYRKHRERLSSGHIMITFAMVAFGLAVVLFQDVIYLIIGPAYRASQQFFSMLLFSPICYTISETTGIGINISKKTYLNMFVYGITIAITFASCRYLIPKLGLIGAAISVAAASLAMLIAKAVIGEKFYKIIDSPVKTFFAPVFFLAVICINTLLFNMFWARTVVTLVAIIGLCIIYKKQFFLIIHLLIGAITKPPQKV